jgi:hypothetical protein
VRCIVVEAGLVGLAVARRDIAGTCSQTVEAVDDPVGKAVHALGSDDRLTVPPLPHGPRLRRGDGVIDRAADSHLEPLADAHLASVLPLDISDELGPRCENRLIQ